jgi:hypothetical protein
MVPAACGQRVVNVQAMRPQAATAHLRCRAACAPRRRIWQDLAGSGRIRQDQACEHHTSISAASPCQACTPACSSVGALQQCPAPVSHAPTLHHIDLAAVDGAARRACAVPAVHRPHLKRRRLQRGVPQHVRVCEAGRQDAIMPSCQHVMSRQARCHHASRSACHVQGLSALHSCCTAAPGASSTAAPWQRRSTSTI